MRLVRAAWAALLLSSLALGQGVSPQSPQPLLPQPAAPNRSLKPESAAPAWLLALRGIPPYADFLEAEMVLPPSAAEVASLPVLQRRQEQEALKAAWLERLIRAREQRNRITPENLAAASLKAQRLGAPAPFVDSLRRQSEQGLSPTERHLQERFQQEMMNAYRVDAREMRFFVEGCGLNPAQLREVADWLPLPALFNSVGLSAGERVSAARLGADYVAYLAVCRDVAPILRSVNDRASADAAADAMLPLLLQFLTTRDSLLGAPEAFRRSVLAPYARFAAPVEEARRREQLRVMQQSWYGSSRLQAVNCLLH